MRVVNVASGSSANCTFVESHDAKILIDEGLSVKNLEERLKILEIDPSTIDAILLTHEHSDHIYGIKSFLNKYKSTKVYIPSYVQSLYIKAIEDLPQRQIEWYVSSDFYIKDVAVSSFVLPHDSRFCVGYSLFVNGKKITIATDLGFVSNATLENLSGSDILYLESNHDENLLRQNVKYSATLKRRILSNHGHLSNKTCGETLAKIVKTGVKQVILAHLSRENNTPILAYSTVKKILADNGIVEGEHVCVDVAFQDKPGTVFNF